MDAILIFGGVVLITIGLLDVFFTVLHYDGVSFLSNPLHRRVWSVVRRSTAPLPRGMRNFWLSLGLRC